MLLAAFGGVILEWCTSDNRRNRQSTLGSHAQQFDPYSCLHSLLLAVLTTARRAISCSLAEDLGVNTIATTATSPQATPLAFFALLDVIFAKQVKSATT
jgi:hypothetical protein